MKKTDLNNKSDSDIKQLITETTTLLDQKTLAIWASDCVEHVMTFFEEKYPSDKRPRQALEATRAWVKGEISIGEARSAAFESHAAAREIEDGVAYAVARAAGHAAATAHVASHAVHAANYAAKVGSKERTWQYEKLLSLLSQKRTFISVEKLFCPC